MLCEACSNIDLEEVVEESGHQLYASYNRLSTSAAKGCRLCSFIREQLPLYKRDYTLFNVQRVDIETGEWLGGTEESYEPLSSLVSSKMFGKKLANAPVVLRVADHETQTSIDDGIRFVQIAIPEFHRDGDWRYDLWQEVEFYARSVDPSASVIRARPVEQSCRSDATFALVASWLKTCIEEHDVCGRDSNKPFPTRVLDLMLMNDNTWDPSLFETRGRSGRWLALSHCWGKVEFLQTTKATLGSHTNRIKFENLPLNFRDAVTITRRLGYRYLWIDSLCIIQDSPNDWRSEAGRMRDVYQNAVLTIMAEASPESGAGIFRSGDSKRRSNASAIAIPYIGDGTDDPGTFYARECVTLGMDASTPLRERGWALQEDVLSPRIVKYSSEQLFWACRTMRCSEADPTTDRQNDDIYEQRRPIEEVNYANLYMSPRSYLEWWYSIVVDNYTHRKLTRTTDSLPAIAGVARQVQVGTGHTYLAGLWIEDILRSLMWMCCGQGTRNRVYTAPTWSWASMTFDLQERFWIYDFITVEPAWKYSMVLVNYDARIISDDLYGEVESGFLRVKGYWKPVDHLAHCPRPFFDSEEDSRFLCYRSRQLTYQDRSPQLLRKQIVCSHDTVPGIDGVGPNLFGKGIVYLLVLKSTWPNEGRDEGDDESDNEDDKKDGDEFEGTIYALILEPTGRRGTYRRIGVAQIPEDDGLAERWNFGELIII